LKQDGFFWIQSGGEIVDDDFAAVFSQFIDVIWSGQGMDICHHVQGFVGVISLELQHPFDCTQIVPQV
jgi:hypothetical protein